MATVLSYLFAVLFAGVAVWGVVMIVGRDRLKMKYRYRGQPWGEQSRLMTASEIGISGIVAVAVGLAGTIIAILK